MSELENKLQSTYQYYKIPITIKTFDLPRWKNIIVIGKRSDLKQPEINEKVKPGYFE